MDAVGELRSNTEPDGAVSGMSQSGALMILAVLFAFVLAAAILVARMKGVWLDELWSLWMSQHDVGFSRALHERWLQDTNPPFFYMFAWLFEPLTRLNLFASRLLNLIPLALASGAFFWLGLTRSRLRPFLIVYAVLMACSALFVGDFGELRSYFSQLCAASVLAAALFTVETETRDLEKRDIGLAIAILFAATAIMSFHQVSALITGVVLGVTGVGHLLARRVKWGVALLAIAFVSGLPLVGAEIAAWPYLTVAAQDFWVTASTADALHIVASQTVKALLLNAAAAGAAVYVLTGLRRTPRQPMSASLRFAVVFAVALGCASIAVVVLNVVKPLIIPRYLIMLTPFWRAALAAVAAEMILSRRWVFALFIANAALITAFTTQDEAFTGNWNDGAEAIADAVDDCSQTLVYAVDPFELEAPGVKAPAPDNEIVVHDWGYGYVGRLHGFAVRIVHPSAIRSIPLSTACPTLLWAEHDYNNRLGLKDIAVRSKLPADPASLARMTLLRTDSGFVLTLAPPTPSR
ncbi:MAG TPA: hypothetical protein VG407_09020 [Caulobacteraceae bacterium]|nr:hypothetical protein [Caulobacteraceae bacterium]